jgi:RNA polymerase sigma-70 factor (ECF subfamily)
MNDRQIAYEGSRPLGRDRAHASVRNDRLRALLDANFMFILRMLRRFGVPRSDLDDAVQQVFIVAATKLDEIAQSSERSFLFGTALRVAASSRRRVRRRCELDAEALAHWADESPRADEVVANRQRFAILDRIVATMADDLRTVFVLCDIEEMTVPEVAALQRIPVGTAASRLRRARREFERRAKVMGGHRGDLGANCQLGRAS